MKVIQEPDQINQKAILVVTLGTILVTLFGALAAWGIIRLSEPEQRNEDHVRTRARGQPDNVNQLEMGQYARGPAEVDRQARVALRLRTYGWADRQEQLVHIPLEKAFEMYLAAPRSDAEAP